MVSFESPIVVPRGMSWGKGRGADENNMRRLIGVVSVAELVVVKHAGIRCIEVHNSTAKSKIFKGKRAPGKTYAERKEAMIAAVTNLGYDVADHHQADAVAVGLCTYDTIQ